MATQSTVIEMPKPGVETDLTHLFEAREATERMVRTLQGERAKAEADLVLELAKEVAISPSNPDAIVGRIRNWQTENQQRLDRIEAVELLHTKIKGRIEDLKWRYRTEATQWLARQIAVLLREEGAQQRRTRVTAAKVKALQQELEALKAKPPRSRSRTGAGRSPAKRRPKA